jgi:hypothetical protein
MVEHGMGNGIPLALNAGIEMDMVTAFFQH